LMLKKLERLGTQNLFTLKRDENVQKQIH